MSDFIKSAFDYFGSGGKSRGTHELVGQSVEIGGQTFRVASVIAEGGFSVVFEAHDAKTNKVYALKRLISHDKETNEEVMHEINFLKKLSGHQNIIRLFTAASIGQQKQGHVGTDFLIVTELCTGGQVIQLMQRRNKAFPYNVTLQLFYQVCKAIEHMHCQKPPIIHRDLKVENLLINNRAVIKLCDFGSATTEAHYPDNSWSGLKRSEVQEEIEKHTTPMYRTPEMLDLYQNFPINQAGDIWALGCILFYFLFNKHPFEDSAKLAILNANYTIPTNVEANDRVCGLIYQMLLIDPRQRLPISEILDEVRSLASCANIPLKPSVIFDKDSLIHLPPLTLMPDTGDTPSSKTVSSKHSALPTRPQPPAPKQLPSTPNKPGTKPSPRPNAVSPVVPPDIPLVIPTKSNISTPTNNTNDGKKVFGMLKEGAGSLMKNIRDASNKVIEHVSSMNKADLDLVYVTSRIIMMPTPGEVGMELLTKDNVENVHTFLEFRHPNQYFIYNLGLKLMSNEKIKERILHMGFDPLKPPSLNNLVSICMHQLNWLLLDRKNVVVVQCADGRVSSGVNVAALLCFCRLVDTSSAAADILRSRRGDCILTASQLRYVDYICRLMRNISDPNVSIDPPHDYAVKIIGIELQPVPLFNRAKTGLRPFVEIFSDYKLVYSSMTNYEDLVLFTHDHTSARISVPNIKVHGDLNVVVYHTRANIVAKGKVSAIKVCETQLYTGYLSSTCTEVCLSKKQLDNCDPEEEKYPPDFSLKILLLVTNKEAMSFNQVQSLSWNSDKFKREIVDRMPQDDRLALFNSKEEMQSCVISSGVKLPMKDSKPKPPIVSAKPKPVESKADFLFTLDWANDKNTNDKKEITPEDSSPESFSHNFLTENNGENIINEYPAEAVGDLLGDFGAEERTFIDNPRSQHAVKNDVDGLADFFSGMSSSTDQRVKSRSNVDLFATFGDTDSTKENDLLCFEYGNIDKGNSFMFDPFGQNASVNSCSTTNLSTQQSRLEDWNIPGSDVIPNHQSPAIIKPSNSTNCLLNLNHQNQIKASPSFNGKQNPQQDVFGNLTDMFDKPFQIPTPASTPISTPLLTPKPLLGAKPAVVTKPAPPPKPTQIKIENKIFDKVENIIQPKNKKDAFQDLLGDFKPSDSKNGSANSGAKSIKDIRKETLCRTTDPEALKILDWIEGREKNIRALLCSLPSILWSDVRWPGVNMSELVTVGQVKKAYKNAIRCVHPDKWNNSEHENLAKMIMMELNEAMSEFEAEKNACS